MSATEEIRPRITIVKAPAGEAPLNIREAWVGVTVPCEPIVGFSGSGQDRGVITRAEVAENRSSYSVSQSEAIGALREVNPQAAEWWTKLGFPQVDGHFGFGEDEAKVVSGEVIRQRIERRDDFGEGGDR